MAVNESIKVCRFPYEVFGTDDVGVAIRAISKFVENSSKKVRTPELVAVGEERLRIGFCPGFEGTVVENEIIDKSTGKRIFVPRFQFR